MSFFKCCVGADPRSTHDDSRPVSTTLSRRGGAHSAFASDGGASKRKMKLPTEVFFDPTKPDGQLSSVTDPATSMREVIEMKKRRDTRDRQSTTTRDNTNNNNNNLDGGSRKLSTKVNVPDDSQNNLSAPNNHYHSNNNNNNNNNNSSRHQQHQQSHHHHHKTDLDVQDNNGLTRGQNFMKVEKWLRNSCMYKQIDITPRDIKNIEDSPSELPENIADPPSEKDRLPPALVNANSSLPTPSR